MINFELTQLKNGLRVITAPLHDTKAVTVLIMAAVGSRYESDNQAGISHFMEHMFFKGTLKRPTPLAISTELDGLGASFNAFTAEEYTGYFVSTSANHFDQAFDIISDMLINGQFRPKELEREKGVIEEEINMYQDIPQAVVEQEHKKLVFGNNPLGRPIAGYKTTVNSFKRQDFINYKEIFYTPSNLVVVVAGNPKFGGRRHDWLKSIKATFNLKDRPSRSCQRAAYARSNQRVSIKTRPSDQAHFILSVPCFGHTDPRKPILKVMVNLLGGMMSSRLFTQVREKRGLAYYISAGLDSFSDTGLLYARAGVRLKGLEQALQITTLELAKLSRELVGPKELAKSIHNLEGSLYLGLEDSMAIASYLAKEALFQPKIRQPEQLIEQFSSVKAKQIKDLMANLFDPKKLRLSLVGPFSLADQTRLEKAISKGYS